MSSNSDVGSSLSDSRTVTGVDTDGSGQVQITMGSLRQIEHVADVDASATGGYVANPVSVSGNTVTLEIYESAGSNAEMAVVASTNGVTDIHIRAEGY